MATSIFDKKEYQPSEIDLRDALKASVIAWDNLFDYLQENYGDITTEWKFYSKKAGWTLKAFDSKKKNIVFLSPNDNYFITTVGMGVKLKETVLQANISQETKSLIEEAVEYVEGISILIKIVDEQDLADVKTILEIKRDNK